jgi:Holliday junction resolvase RusA-like endonuclease
MEIEFNQLPPSENKIRIIRVMKGRPGGMAYTKEATNYKKDFKKHMLDVYAADIVKFAAGHSPCATYEVRIDLFFTKEQLVNSGWPNTKTYYKKMDVGNRRKLLEDCIAEVLGIDDLYTFDLRLVKQVTDQEGPYVKVTIEQRNHTDYGITL